MKIISWNINGFRAIMKKGFQEFLDYEMPNIMCLQETKINEDREVKGYYAYWNHAEKKGYSGTAILFKNKPIKIIKGIGIEKFDKEGRTITAELPEFWLVNVYVPNAQRELTRLELRQEWDEELLKYLKKLNKTKPVIVCGDFNVAHEEIDLARPKQNIGNAGFTFEERKGMTNYLKNGFVDAFRYKHPKEIKYSWWSYMFHARDKNIGWRIDYFLVSEDFKERIKDSYILTEVKGSDHAPIVLEITNK